MWQHYPKTEMIDIERILSTGIPDISPVYDGVRGRTMSSRHQSYAWPAIVEAGIRSIIDLREADKSDRLPRLCQNNGLQYFHYPVDNTTKTVPEMVELFPRFCEMIDQGRFYIACAMGLHRTDVALCTYWVFHGADLGIAAPPLRGYRKAEGHDANKIMRVLNAFYRHMTEKDDQPPMPMEVFKERKKIIEEMSNI